MLSCFIRERVPGMIPIKPLLKTHFDSWVNKQDAYVRHWLHSNRFIAEPGTSCLVPDRDGKISTLLVGLATPDDYWAFGDLPLRLSGEHYYLDLAEPIWAEPEQWQRPIIAWGLGSYSFSRYQKRNRKPNLVKPQLFLPPEVNPGLCEEIVASLYGVRDLINTPAEDMSPAVLAQAAVELAESYGATAQVISGENLLAAGYPTIYTVGRGSARPPCLVDFSWGELKAPLLTLVGKGICFDSGGMNLKSTEGMRFMKKDMGGAAHVLGLARLIMCSRLPVRLRVLLAIADNMVTGNSYRPGDIITTRAGITVEISNTDAEGRLVLCDALAAAVEAGPELIIDFSTLTGAARVAVGPDMAAFFANNETLAADLMQASQRSLDPIWRLPLYQPYERYLKSEIADICNATAGPYAGAVTAALYLKQFVPNTIPWAHFDFSAWNFDRLPGRPIGAEANALRAVFTYLQGRYQ